MTAHPVPAIGVGAIVFDAQGRVLLIRRGRPPAAGAWSVPGGKQQPGETLVEACRREFTEETGLAIAVGPVVAIVERRVEGFHYVIVDFLAALEQPAPRRLRPADDAVDACWAHMHQLGRFELVDGLARVIKRAEAMNQAAAGRGLIDIDGAGLDFIAG